MSKGAIRVYITNLSRIGLFLIPREVYSRNVRRFRHRCCNCLCFVLFCLFFIYYYYYFIIASRGVVFKIGTLVTMFDDLIKRVID